MVRHLMREFFQDRRRQVGCVTLALACIVTSAWVRSLSVCDCVGLTIANRDFQLISVHGRLVWRATMQYRVSSAWEVHPMDSDKMRNFWRNFVTENCRKDRGVFYFPVAVALALSSAYLLLRGSQKRGALEAGEVPHA
jgi:hypothetical protein